VYEYGESTGEVAWDSQNSALQKADTVLYKDWNARINSPSSVQGAIYNTTNTLTDRGTYDARLVYEESIPDTVQFRQSSTRFRDGQAIQYENSRSAIVAPSATGSGIYQVNQRMNQDGTYSGSLTYEYGTNTGYAEFASNEAVLASADTIIYKDVNEQIAAPPAAIGGIYSVTNSLTECCSPVAITKSSGSCCCRISHCART
jgi:phage baseplate assembly protein gpV